MILIKSTVKISQHHQCVGFSEKCPPWPHVVNTWSPVAGSSGGSYGTFRGTTILEEDVVEGEL